MITVDPARCSACDTCLEHMGGYCLRREGGAIVIDRTVCNGCLKCVAVCPRQAFLLDGKPPARITGEAPVRAEDLAELLRRRRSIKAYRDVPVRRELLEAVVRAGAWAPTMNRAIEAIVVDDPPLIQLIDQSALRQVRRWRALLFGFPPLTWLLSRFVRELPVIRRKMARDLDERRRVVKLGTRALILVVGDPRVPVTESSAQHCLAYMTIMAQALGLGSCLMDSLRLALNGSGACRAALGIPRALRVLGVLTVGVPAEKIVNVPEGLELRVAWRSGGGGAGAT